MPPQPTRTNEKELRKFGFMFAALFCIFAGLLIPWLWGTNWPLWPWVGGGAVFAMALAVPAALAPVYRIWMLLGDTLGWINSRIILSVLFFAVVTPIAFIFKLLGKDPLHRRLETSRNSYREAAHEPDRESLERPF